MPERLRLMIELAAWCALRFGEVAEFRRGDVDLKNGVIRVTRAAQWIDDTKIVAAPKTDSVRVVAFAPHTAEAIRDHLKNHTQWGMGGLLSGYRRIGWTCPRRTAAGDQSLAFLDVVHPVAGAVVDADFGDSGADRSDVSGVPGRQSGEADEDTGRGASVFQCGQPSIERR